MTKEPTLEETMSETLKHILAFTILGVHEGSITATDALAKVADVRSKAPGNAKLLNACSTAEKEIRELAE